MPWANMSQKIYVMKNDVKGGESTSEKWMQEMTRMSTVCIMHDEGVSGMGIRSVLFSRENKRRMRVED